MWGAHLLEQQLVFGFEDPCAASSILPSVLGYFIVALGNFPRVQVHCIIR